MGQSVNTVLANRPIEASFDKHSEIPSRRKYFNVPETYSNLISHSKIYWEDLFDNYILIITFPIEKSAIAIFIDILEIFYCRICFFLMLSIFRGTKSTEIILIPKIARCSFYKQKRDDHIDLDYIYYVLFMKSQKFAIESIIWSIATFSGNQNHKASILAARARHAPVCWFSETFDNFRRSDCVMSHDSAACAHLTLDSVSWMC